MQREHLREAYGHHPAPFPPEARNGDVPVEPSAVIRPWVWWLGGLAVGFLAAYWTLG